MNVPDALCDGDFTASREMWCKFIFFFHLGTLVGVDTCRFVVDGSESEILHQLCLVVSPISC